MLGTARKLRFQLFVVAAGVAGVKDVFMSSTEGTPE
jgi:hypothetical protein